MYCCMLHISTVDGDWLPGNCPACTLIDWLTDWLIDWLIDRLIDWFCLLYHSGRTQHQARHSQEILRSQPDFERVSSKRFSSKVLDGKWSSQTQYSISFNLNDCQFSCDVITFQNWKLSFLKVPMTWKIFSAYLKGLSKYRRMAFFFLKYLFSF